VSPRSATVPTAAANFVAPNFYVDVHAGPSTSATPVIACGDLSIKAQKSAAVTRLKGSAEVEVPFEYLEAGHLTHGYATTVHKSQGVTCDVVLCSAPGRSP
jgi:hypothetical protein